MVGHLLDRGKSIWDGLIVPYVTKILQNFWLTLVIKRLIILSLFNGISTFVGYLMPKLFS